jgi:hypothetical protein
VLVTLEGKFLIVKLKYLVGLLLPVEEVLYIFSEILNCSSRVSSSAKRQGAAG